MTQLHSGENLEEKHGFTMKINTSGDAGSVVRMPQCCPFFSAFLYKINTPLMLYLLFVEEH